jgi:hypothetical protein
VLQQLAGRAHPTERAHGRMGSVAIVTVCNIRVTGALNLGCTGCSVVLVWPRVVPNLVPKLVPGVLWCSGSLSEPSPAPRRTRGRAEGPLACSAWAGPTADGHARWTYLIGAGTTGPWPSYVKAMLCKVGPDELQTHMLDR